MHRIRPPVKTHGGKFYLAPWVIDNFPQDYEHLIYTEVFVGGGSVLLNKKPSQVERINDADWNIYCVWHALRHSPVELYGRLKLLKYSEETFEASKEYLLQDQTTASPEFIFETAIHEYVVRRMSRGGMRKAFAWSDRLRGGKPGDVNAWETSLDAIPMIAERSKYLEISMLDFRKVLENIDGPENILYLDPPYLKSTRAKGATEVYSYEMSDSDHKDLLELCVASKSKILLSGYESQLYDSYLMDWNKVYKDVKNHSAQNLHKSTKREVLWKNY